LVHFPVLVGKLHQEKSGSPAERVFFADGKKVAVAKVHTPAFCEHEAHFLHRLPKPAERLGQKNATKTVSRSS
jgi:hypothetical protein